MKEGGPLYDKVVDCNWVPKRKRKLKSVAFDATAEKEDLISSEITKESTSIRKVIKGEHSSQCSQRVMGQDGYYFECEHCDLGGNLLCCDNCPRTYHLECLNPPLKRAPAGKWVCPKCCSQEVGKPSSNLETSSLRVRSKTAKKALAAYSTSSSDKTSHLERDLLESSKSFGKGKAASSHRAAFDKMKSNSLLAGISANISPSFSDDSILEDGASAIGVLKMKKKAVSSSQRKLNAENMVPSLVKSLNLHLSDKVTKKKRNFSRNEKQGKKFVIPVAVSSHILKKAKKKINKIDKVSSKSLNGEHSPKISDHSCGEASPGHVSVSYSKCKSGEHISSNASLKEGTILLKSSRLKKPEISPHGASSFLSHGLNELGENLEKTITCQGFFHDAQQVDRILGCRIKTGSSGIRQPTSIIASQEKLNAEREMLQTEFPSVGFTSQESHDQVDCFDKSDAVEVKLENAMDIGFQCEANLTALKIAQNSIELENGVKGKTCEICNNTHKDDALSLTSQPLLDNCMACKGFELDDSSTGDINVGDSFAEKCLECHDATTELKCSRSSVDTSVPKRSVQESRLQDTELVAYEFFVKWAGKSNIHNSWVSEDQLKILAKRKLENYKAKYGVAIINICEEQWCQPQRIISFIESDNGEEALVKWCGLSYDECTWEKLDEPAILIASHLFSEFKQIESQTLNKDAIANFMRTDFHDVVPLTEQPKELKGGSLFPHQLEALNWLRKCWKKSKNVILADEMGLGKTVSACSFISSLYFEFKVKLPCLVLVPLSTMPNWLAEFASWTHLNVVEYHGSAKARSVIRQYEWHASDANRPDKLSKAYKFNVLLTTYEMILADSSHLRGVPWEVLVVDEGHRLKNSESKLFSLLNTFSFQHRVLLTGTPLQNNLGEMYNLLNFLQPCSFPSLSSFEEKFNDLSTAEKVEELKKLVAPHMLRRLKRDAMQNIPPKTERIVPVELTSIQAEYYRAMLTKNYQILRNIGKGVAQQSMLNIVMQLRKVCNHPYLIPGTEPESGSLEFLQEMRIKASAKLSLLHSMLKILHKEGHRVLIFSQMTKLLDILEDYLTVEFGPGTYERVDGSVSVANRQAAIVRFNQNKTRFVFLLSTRSCGLGINLATADTVIIYDSDFNPHADIQAMNRAHRIGQSNRLLVYRLVVRASVEERILQLAKKKLMLDQLFVNKSGSQKEVEDILRWGTEELFSDSDDAKNDYINNVDTTTDGEHKHRRRSGCLGDVYRDKCTNVGKFSWDENAILKLLDRSNLQSCISENVDVDLENDLLGSVKSLDWNDEPINEESGGSELLTNISGDCCEPPLDAKDDNTNTFQGENEWDRLLRVRWEKCQLEEGEVLGRGKRLRKAISYKEAFVSMQNEALSESASDDEVKQEYTPAGQALKEKFAKLRARQKERIARQRSMQSLLPHIEGSTNGEPRYEDIDACELDLLAKPQEAECSQKFDSMRITNSMVKNGWSTNNGLKMDHINCLDLSVNTTGNLSTEISQNNHMKQPGLAALISSSNHLPVLGLCAPNAMKTHSTSRTFKARVSKHAFQNERSKSAVGFPNFPSASADVGAGLFVGSSSRDALADPLTLADTPMAALNHRLKDIISDRHLPFFSPPHPTIGRGLSELGESSGTSYPQFYEKFGLPRFDHDGAFLPKFASPPKSSRKRQKDFFTNLPLSTKIDPDLSKVHPSANFRRDLDEFLKQKQQLFEFPPALGLSTPLTLPALPDNHKKVLDNIMMRTQTAVHKFWKKKLKTNAWSEDELDALWIGVRRHGSGNWDAILRNPKLKVLKHRSTEELSSRWNEEQHKIFDGPTSFPNLTSAFSDGLRTQALHNSKFSAFGQELSKSHSHLRDIKLAYGDLMPKFPCFEQSSHAGTASESLPSLPFGPSDKFGSSYARDFSASMLIKPPEKIVLPSQDQFATHNSFSGTLFGPTGMNSGSNHTLPLNEDLPAAVETLDFPIPPDKPPNFLCGKQNIDSGVSETEMSFYGKKKRGFSKFSMDEDSDLGSSSNANKLPHWLREAVSAPTSRSEPMLPPSVSAITHSVRLLYGKENSSIPPFLMPEHPPVKPEDPRKILRKRRKFDRHQRAAPNASNSVFVSASSSAPLFLPLLPSMLPTSVPPLPPMLASSVSTPLLPSFICPVPLSVPTPTPYSFLPEPLKEVPLPSLFRKETVPTLQSLNLESLSSQSLSAPLSLAPFTAKKMPKYSEFSASKDSDLGEGFECLPMKHQWADSSTNVSCEDKQIFEQVDLTKSGGLDNVKSDSFNATDDATKMQDVLPMEDFSGSKCEQES